MEKHILKRIGISIQQVLVYLGNIGYRKLSHFTTRCYQFTKLTFFYSAYTSGNQIYKARLSLGVYCHRLRFGRSKPISLYRYRYHITLLHWDKQVFITLKRGEHKTLLGKVG